MGDEEKKRLEEARKKIKKEIRDLLQGQYLEYGTAVSILRMTPLEGRRGWLHANAPRLVKALNRKQFQRLRALCLVGMSRKRLKEMGVEMRPRQVRILVERA